MPRFVRDEKRRKKQTPSAPRRVCGPRNTGKSDDSKIVRRKGQPIRLCGGESGGGRREEAICDRRPSCERRASAHTGRRPTTSPSCPSPPGKSFAGQKAKREWTAVHRRKKDDGEGLRERGPFSPGCQRREACGRSRHGRCSSPRARCGIKWSRDSPSQPVLTGLRNSFYQ
jgi:hypothetical protein